MDCKHCNITIGNRLVVMEDNTIHCYTCGRLRAEQKSRRLEIFVETLEALEERRGLYGQQ